MPNRFAAGCQCCGEAGNTFGSQGEAEVTWIARPCSVGTYANRIGVDITIQNLSDCTDYEGFFGFNCGTCTRTFSNMNGTYYVPVTIDEVGGSSIGSESGVTYSGQPIINQILGQWYTGSSSCSGSPSNGTCTEAGDYPYFKVEALLECDATDGLRFYESGHVYLYLCTEGGTKFTERSAVASAPGTLVFATMRPDCCNISKVTAPSGNCCNVGVLTIQCNADSQGTAENKFKYDWVTT